LADFNSPKIFSNIADFRANQEFPDNKTMVIVDKDSRIFYANRSFEYFFGFGEGRSLFDIESEPNIVYLIEGIAKSNYCSLHFELYLSGNNKKVDGNYSVDIEKIFIKEQQYFLLIITSLEEKNRIEAKINNLNDALEYGNVPVIIADNLGYITYCTKSFEEILNKGIEEIFRASIADVFEDYLSVNDLSELIDSLENNKIWRKRIEKRDSEGNEIFKEILLNPVAKPGGSAGNYIIIANDITDYVLKHRIIQKSEIRQKSIINNISDLLLILKTEKGSYIFENANENFCSVFGIDRVGHLKQDIKDLFSYKFLDTIFNSIDRLKTGVSSTSEFQYSNESMGRIYSGNISFTDDKFEEERIYIISLKDITQQIQYEEQLKKTLEKESQLNKLKTIFIENMSHELRTPYNALIGYSEILDDEIKEGNTESAMEIVASLKEVFGRVLNLFSNIIEVSQIESGEINLSKVRMNCNKILNSVYVQYKDKADERHVEFNVELEKAEFLIEVDWLKLEKIIDVLVDNAVKYTNQGEIRLSTKLTGRRLSITVADTGIGIKEEDIEKLLQPFSQEEDVYTRSYQGAGLGLTIAHKLTRLMGGEFNITSSVENGTVIELIFPAFNEIA
jgi:signal transduction histidine kinase